MPGEPSGLSVAGMSDADPLYLTADKQGVADRLAEKLARTGIKTRVVDSLPEDATHVIMLSGLRRDIDPRDADRTVLDQFRQLRHCAGTMQKDGRLLVTVQDTGGAFSPSDPNRAGIGGLGAFAKTAGREWPHVEIKAIDVARHGRDADDLADALFQELVFGGLELEVGLDASGQRFVLEALPADAPVHGMPLENGDVLVVSGGARGVTVDCLSALAEQASLRFVLLGRSVMRQEQADTMHLTTERELKQYLFSQSGKAATPMEIDRKVKEILAGREIRNALEKLESLGSQARYVAADIGDTKTVSDALDNIRKDWGGISGIIHAAGVLSDKAISDMTPEQFEVVFNTKVGGLNALLAATEQDRLKLLCCFSSMAARVGNPGQLNYNVANETLNKMCVAEKAQRPDCVVKSIGWGAWDGGMVTPALKRHFEQLGVELIDRRAGARAFVAEISAGPESAVEILLTGKTGKGFALTDPERHRRASVWFHDRTFPFLKDHIIEKAPVVPMFFAVELAARCALGAGGQKAVNTVRDVRVYKGIQLPDFFARGHWVDINITPNPEHPGCHCVEFRNSDGILNYRLTVETGDPLPAETFDDDPNAFGTKAWDWQIDDIYRDRSVLFHTGVFQCISALGKIDHKGLNLTVSPKAMKYKPETSWVGDTMLIDGGAQAAVLWGWHFHKQHVLPSGVKAVTIHQSGLGKGPLDCYMKVVKDTANQCWFDYCLVDENKRIAAKIHRIEMTKVINSWIPEDRKRHAKLGSKAEAGEGELSALEKALGIDPLELEPFDKIQIITEERHLQQYADVYKRVFVDELEEPRYPVPKLEDLRGSIVAAGLIGDEVVGGFRIFPPDSGPLACYKILEPGPDLPDWRELRRFGAIGELTSLILLPEARGDSNLAEMWQYIKRILITLGSDYALINGLTLSKSYLLYSAFGFKPIAPPIRATFPVKSGHPILIPMIIKLREDLPLPPCVMDIGLTRIEEFAKNGVPN